MHSLRNSGFSEDEIRLVYEELCYSPLNDVAVDQYAYEIARHMYTNTCVSIEGSNGIIHTQSGSSAGIPLADLVYSIAMSRVLKRFRIELSASNITRSISINGNTHENIEISYVDDTVLPIFDRAETIVNTTVHAAKTAISCFHRYAKILNVGKGKTEALVSFVCPDSKSSRVQLLVVDKSTRSFRVESLEHSISFVSSYKHLGSMSSISNNIGAEVCLRNGIMLSESERLR